MNQLSGRKTAAGDGRQGKQVISKGQVSDPAGPGNRATTASGCGREVTPCGTALEGFLERSLRCRTFDQIALNEQRRSFAGRTGSLEFKV